MPTLPRSGKNEVGQREGKDRTLTSNGSVVAQAQAPLETSQGRRLLLT